MLTVHIASREVLPLTEVRKRVGAVSLPAEPDDTALAPFGYATLTDEDRPDVSWTQVATLGDPILSEGVWVRQWEVIARANGGADYLAELQEAAKNRIDLAAGEVRGTVMSTGTGMEAVYAIKAQRAAEYIADPSPADANYPLLALEAAELGISTAELASTVQTMSGQWEAFAGSIEAIRVSRKAQVDLAETPDEITAIEAAIEWPSLA